MLIHERKTKAAHDPKGLTHVTWNHSYISGVMFATASHDGYVRLWVSPRPKREA